jgi:hypothetical protein
LQNFFLPFFFVKKNVGSSAHSVSSSSTVGDGVGLGFGADVGGGVGLGFGADVGGGVGLGFGAVVGGGVGDGGGEELYFKTNKPCSTPDMIIVPDGKKG